MFKAMFDESSTFRDAIKAMTSFIDEGSFIISPEGIRMNEMAEDRTMMILLNIPLTYLNEFEFEPENELRLGVSLTDLARILKHSKLEKLTLSLVKIEGKERLSVQIDNRYFYLPVLEIEPTAGHDISKLEYDLSLEMDPKTFYMIMKEAKTIMGDDLRIKTDMDNRIVIFESESETGELYQYKLELEEDVGVFGWEIRDEVDSLYSMDRMEKIAKGYKIAATAKIECSTEKPIKITFIAQGGMELTYLLAPRIL
jgi:DNA polymerase III sliding clamp (beta) subunit (PCNA family)